MSNLKRIHSIGIAAALAILLATPASQAALFTYAFTGEVTAVSNPIGLFTNSAAIGAPVIGSFTYTDTPNTVPFSFNDNFTNHLHSNGLEPDTLATELAFNIGGTTVNSFPSLSTQMVGNDNPIDTFPPFFPVGDSFRYSDQLDIFSPLFDLTVSDFFQYASGILFFVDSTGEVFNSQALPSGLPLSSFDIQFGLVDIFDDNFEETGRLTFRIDSIRAVPEPGTVTMLCVTAIAFATQFRTRRLNSDTIPQ